MTNHDPIAYAAYVRAVTEAAQEAHLEVMADVAAFGTRGTTSKRYAAITKTEAAEQTAALNALLAARA